MRKRKKVKTRLLKNVYFIEMQKMRSAGLSYKKIASELSLRHKKHFSVGLVYKIFNE
jgi:hypothetical protein